MVEAAPSLIRWRQGRSLPYGEGVRFWALAEMVKAQAGILETDGPAASRESSRAVRTPSTVEADWVAAHLRRSSASSVDGGPSAARRSPPGGVLEALAEQRPARARVRGPAVGGRRPPRLRRPPRRLGERRADARRLHRAAELSSAGRGGVAASERGRLAAAALRGRDRELLSTRCSTARCCPPRRSSRCSRGPAATRSTPRSSRG